MASGSAPAGGMEARVHAFISAAAEAPTIEDIQAGVGNPPTAHVVELLNAMLQARAIIMMTSPSGGSLRYKAAGAREAKVKGLNTEEVMVFQQIQKAANSGVWTKDLKVRTNLAQPQITKILKALEARGLIKSIKSVANPSRKLVMLAELEPSKEVTGGAWYTESQQFDAEFIAIVREALLRHIERQREASLEDITAWITGSGLVKNVSLGEDDVQQVLESLCYEGELDNVGVGAASVYRRAIRRYPDTTPLTSLPCGRCPVMDQCREGGPISPATCEYYQAWLNF